MLTESVQIEGSTASSMRWPTQPLALRRSTISRGTDSAEVPAAAPGRDRRRRCRLHAPGPAGSPRAARPWRQDGAGHHRRHAGRLQQLVARYPGRKVDQRQTHFTRLTLELVGAAGRRASRRRRWCPGAAGQRQHPQQPVRATDDAGLPDAVAIQTGRDLLHRHRLPPRTAQGRHLQPSSTSPSAPTAKPCPGTKAPAACWPPSSSTPAATHQAVWFVDGQGGGAATSARRPEPQRAPSWPARWSSRA
jgi:hypothetical protein